MNRDNIKAYALAAGLAVVTVDAAQAQASAAATPVTLYGLIDVGVEHVSNVGAAGKGLTRLPSNTGSLPSRWGLRGSEDLGAGFQATFTLESGFAPDTGALGQGGRSFGRQAFIGLSGEWGIASLGRQYTMMFWGHSGADLSGGNLYGVGSLDSYPPNARVDNAIAYRGTFGSVSVGATYSLGRDTAAGGNPAATNCAGENAADKNACREWSAMLKFDTPDWGVALINDEMRGGTGAFAGLTSSALKDQRTVLNGYVKVAGAKVTAGLMRRDNDGAAPLSATNGQSKRSNLYWVGATYSFSPAFTLDGQLHRLGFQDGGDRATLGFVRGSYSLSKRTTAYAQLAHISNGPRLAISVSAGAPGSSPTAGGSQNAVIAGLRHAF